MRANIAGSTAVARVGRSSAGDVEFAHPEVAVDQGQIARRRRKRVTPLPQRRNSRTATTVEGLSENRLSALDFENGVEPPTSSFDIRSFRSFRQLSSQFWRRAHWQLTLVAEKLKALRLRFRRRPELAPTCRTDSHREGLIFSIDGVPGPESDTMRPRYTSPFSGSSAAEP